MIPFAKTPLQEIPEKDRVKGKELAIKRLNKIKTKYPNPKFVSCCKWKANNEIAKWL